MNRKYSTEVRERALRMLAEARPEHPKRMMAASHARPDPSSKVGAIKRIADQLGLHPEALRTWVWQAEVDGGIASGVTTIDAQRIADLERENRELRRANEILKTASAFFAAAELDRKLK